MKVHQHVHTPHVCELETGIAVHDTTAMDSSGLQCNGPRLWRICFLCAAAARFFSLLDTCHGVATAVPRQHSSHSNMCRPLLAPTFTKQSSCCSPGGVATCAGAHLLLCMHAR